MFRDAETFSGRVRCADPEDAVSAVKGPRSGLYEAHPGFRFFRGQLRPAGGRREYIRVGLTAVVRAADIPAGHT